MTGFMHEKEFSRKNFLKGSGAVVAGLSVGAGFSGNASAAAPTSAGYLPDATKLDSWLSVNPDNTVTLKMSQIEVGNGITTGFLIVLAEELDMDMSQMHYGQGHYDSAGFNNNTIVDTWVVTSTGGEGGSNAMSGQGVKIRAAGVAARAALLGLASKQLGVPVGSLTVSKGVVSGGGKTVTYGDLMGGKLFNQTISPTTILPGVAPSKPIANYSLVTKRDVAPRKDIPAKVNGLYTYVHNIRVPGMLHGRVVRPRGQGAYPYNSNVAISVDKSSIAHIPGASVVQVGNFLGVVALKEYDAIQASQQLKVVYNDNPILSGDGNLWKRYRDLDKAGQIPTRYGSVVGDVDKALASAAHVVSGTFAHHYQGHMPIADSNTDNPPRFTADTGGVPAAMAKAAKTVSATYKYQYNNFVPIGPHAAVADIKGTTSGIVYLQGQNLTQAPALSSLLGIPAQNIRVIWYEGSSSYGGGQQASGCRAGREHLPEDRQAGASAVDALGSARLGQLRPVPHVRREGRHRCDRQDRRDGLGQLRPGRRQHRHAPRAARDGHVAVASGSRQRRAHPVRRGGLQPGSNRASHRCVPVRAACAGEVTAGVLRVTEDQCAPGSERSAVVLRQRADR